MARVLAGEDDREKGSSRSRCAAHCGLPLRGVSWTAPVLRRFCGGQAVKGDPKAAQQRTPSKTLARTRHGQDQFTATSRVKPGLEMPGSILVEDAHADLRVSLQEVRSGFRGARALQRVGRNEMPPVRLGETGEEALGLRVLQRCAGCIGKLQRAAQVLRQMRDGQAAFALTAPELCSRTVLPACPEGRSAGHSSSLISHLI